METIEVKPSGRPVRNLKPVSYKESSVTTKRSPTSDKSEPKDKKKKKANGNADEPTKKSGKKKAADPIDESNEQNGDGDDDLMPESQQQSVASKSAAEKPTANSKKAQPRKKKAEEESDNAEEVNDSANKKVQNGASKPPIRRKGKDAAEETANGEGSSKSEEVVSKPGKVKKTKGASAEVRSDNQDDAPIEPVVSKSAKNKKAAPVSAEVRADSDEAPNEPTVSKPSKSSKGKKDAEEKPVSSKNSKGKKADKEESNDAKDESDSQEEAATKSARGKKTEKKESTDDEVAAKSKSAKSARGKKGVKESNDVVDDGETTETQSKAGKGRSKKPVAKEPTSQHTVRGSKRKAVESIQNTVVKPKKAKPAPQTEIQSTDYILQSPNDQWNFKISTWNVAGLRAVVKKNGVNYLIAENPDIICLQETKCQEQDVPPEVTEIKGYHKYWHGGKGGHAGVALFSKVMPYEVKIGFGDKDESEDEQAQLITAEYTKFFVISVYVPNAGRKLVNLQKRLDWDVQFRDFVLALNKKKPVIICGDLNVAHEEIDLANPKSNKKNAGFTQEERNSFTQLLSKGFVDTYRHLYPDRKNSYTFWTYMANARAKNVGWRLDYFVVSEKLVTNVVDNMMRSDVLGSDHCPVTLFLKL